MRKVIILLCLFLFSCSIPTHEKFVRGMNSWIGKPEEDIIAKLGPPKRFYELNGKRYLTFGSSSSGYVPATANSYIIGNSVQTQVYGGYSTQWYCYATYVVENGVIVSASWEGNDCTAN